MSVDRSFCLCLPVWLSACLPACLPVCSPTVPLQKAAPISLPCLSVHVPVCLLNCVHSFVCSLCASFGRLLSVVAVFCRPTLEELKCWGESFEKLMKTSGKLDEFKYRGVFFETLMKSSETLVEFVTAHLLWTRSQERKLFASRIASQYGSKGGSPNFHDTASVYMTEWDWLSCLEWTANVSRLAWAIRIQVACLPSVFPWTKSKELQRNQRAVQTSGKYHTFCDNSPDVSLFWLTGLKAPTD